MPLDLLIPDLLAAPTAVRMPALERWLVRADTATLPSGHATTVLASSYALGMPPPVAAITLAADDASRDGVWLRADPVHLRIGQDAIALHHSGVLGVTRDEALSLVDALQALFKDDGLEFLAPVPDRWYVRVPPGEMPLTVPLAEALGRNIFGLLPHGSGRINWGSVITEAQMILATHEVNVRREERGAPAINSVWFWGEGESPASVARPYDLVMADDAFTRGLAIRSGARLLAAPPSLSQVDAVPAGASVLVACDTLASAMQAGDAEAHAKAAAQLDEQWFVALGDAIERFDGVNLILPRARDTLVARLVPGAKWRWFRRSRPLSSHA